MATFAFGGANSNQLRAIGATEGLLLITAGPGTGKTFTLVKRVTYLILERGVVPGNIFVATFTEKAARELVTYISNELAARGLSRCRGDIRRCIPLPLPPYYQGAC